MGKTVLQSAFSCLLIGLTLSAMAPAQAVHVSGPRAQKSSLKLALRGAPAATPQRRVVKKVVVQRVQPTYRTIVLEGTTIGGGPMVRDNSLLVYPMRMSYREDTN